MLWARVVRGAASIAKAVTCALASRSRPARSKGLSIPTRRAPAFTNPSSSGEGMRTFKTTCAPKAWAWEESVAPAAS